MLLHGLIQRGASRFAILMVRVSHGGCSPQPKR